MKIKTHETIDQTLCGTPIEVEKGCSQVELRTTRAMAADTTGLVHGGFLFGLADYAAMLAVNHPNVVLGSAEVRFLKPVEVGDKVLARAQVEEVQGKKQAVVVSVMKSDETVFQGRFTCFALDKHVLASSKA